ncbi:MAG: phosphotransferase [Thermodesulfovibrionales bacterium]
MKACNAFVVAAGLGERLRPLTNHIPKPLLPLVGSPVIETVLERVSSFPVKRIGINMHYKWEMIRDWASLSRFSDRITLFREEKLLGTGGALKNAAPMLAGSPFLVHNADIISDIDMNLLLEVHNATHNLATLAVHDYSAYNNVWIDAEGKLKVVSLSAPAETQDFRPVAFTGIAIYSPDFLDFLPEGESSVVDAWTHAISCGHCIATVDVTGCSWTDIGSPVSYAEAVKDALARAGEQFHIDPSVECPCGMSLEGWAVLEKGCMISGKTSIKRSIILAGACVEAGADLQDVIAGPGYSVNIESVPKSQSAREEKANSLFLNNFISNNSEVSLIGFGGSDRSYYRIRSTGRSEVLLKTTAADPDYIRQITYTDFFRRYSVPVPELFAKEDKEGEAVFEDLGDVSLYVWLKCRRDPEDIEFIYRRVLDMLITIHTRATEHVAECRLLQTRLFDYEHLRWETDYFLERFVRGLKGVEIAKGLNEGLLREFDRLATMVDSYSKTIVHRDFQSQNIMIKDNDTPRLIDYQGARIGPPAYDLVSMLWDPYYQLEGEMRSRLVQYYLRGMREYSGKRWREEEFVQTMLPCRLQRHMQALGAYGFLARIKGKAYFLKHVPQALHYLTEETEAVVTEFPCLSEVVKLLNDKI